jgi:hypothetical protein
VSKPASQQAARTNTSSAPKQQKQEPVNNPAPNPAPERKSLSDALSRIKGSINEFNDTNEGINP